MTEEAVRTALQRRRPLTVSLAELGAQDLLTLLAEDGGSYHIRVKSGAAWVDVEIGSGIVMGARADGAEGRPAYLLLRKIASGVAFVRPKRFLSMANVLEPIAALPDLSKLSSAPPPVANVDTIEIVLPPMPPPPRVAAARRSSAPPVAEKPGANEKPGAKEKPGADEKPRAKEKNEKKKRPALAFAGIALGVWGLGAGVLAALLLGEPAAPAHAEPIVAGELAVTPPEPASTAPFMVEEEPVVEEASTPEARTLAREARMLLRQGRSRAALRRARQALHMRPGAPFYQTLVGDALAANGQDEEARRMWRRAHRGRRR